MSQDITALKLQIEEYHHREKLYKKLGTQGGFFQYYFEQLPKHKTQVECYYHTNGLYMDLFGEEKYSDYDSFRKVYNRYMKNKK